MSSILKALKKLEDDKVARRPDELKIDAEILRVDSSPGYSLTGIVIASLLLMACGSGVTYLYLNRDIFSDHFNSQSISPLSQNHQPAATGAYIKTEELPVVVEKIPALTQKNTLVEPSKVYQIAAPAGKEAVVSTTQKVKPIVASRPAVSEKKSITNLSTVPAVVKKAVPKLRVTGIAFQNSGADSSIAIVNTIPVSKGSVIEGVTVGDIQKDRVVFLYNGEKIEIMLGQSNQ